VEVVKITLTDEALDLARRQGGVIAVDFIPPIA